MSVRIQIKRGLLPRYLEVRGDGIRCRNGTLFERESHFTYEQIDGAVRTANELSLQACGSIFRIPIDPANGGHRAVIARLVEELQRSARSTSRKGNDTCR
jgi:hypothetical protein